jgi:hypothetical protein
VHGVAVVLACFSLITLLLAWSRWLVGRRLAAAGHLLLAVAAGWGAAALWPILASLDTYEPLVRDQVVAELHFEQTGSRSFRATLTRLPVGQIQVFEMSGDQWRIEARTLDWRGRAAQLGLRPAYRLERLSARHTRPVPGQDPAASSYALGEDRGDDVWAKARTSPAWMRYAQGNHADGPWQPLANGARFAVRIEGRTLLVDPANEAAAVSEDRPR